ncbi:hypothetical protein Vadar_019059 [Vaccinium darrowii]|uniref:Uncharacterized protein n=1 Tax=Vaccinium darrowii TaxID=229202 RepID=A0ACB7Y0E1_9ERIC|nr:hypothetical protein Vadar_019059 [Vaccinium darrowii]
MTSRIRADEVQYPVKKLLARENRKEEVKSLFYKLTFNLMMKMVSGERFFEGRKKRSFSNTEEGDEKGKNIIDVMLLLQESEEFYTDDVIKAIIKVMLIGGTETSITTLKAAVSFMISHLNEFNKARDEIDSNVGQSRLMDDGSWGDPILFKPERFIGVEGEKLGFKLFPFSSGRRACLGEKFGQEVYGIDTVNSDLVL